MKNKRLLVIIAALSTTLIVCGILLKPNTHSNTNSLGYIQGILMEQIKYQSEVYYNHNLYSTRLNDDTVTVLIYRYSPDICSSCYQEDLLELKEFQKNEKKVVTLILPAYPVTNRSNLMKIEKETQGFKYKNIPSDSLSLPLNMLYEEKRYFAVINEQGRIGMVFFPVTDHLYLTRRYLQEVARTFN